jgi:hypothetical protein
VRTARSRASASELAGALQAADIACDEIYLKRPTLDDVFRQITGGTEQ